MGERRRGSLAGERTDDEPRSGEVGTAVHQRKIGRTGERWGVRKKGGPTVRQLDSRTTKLGRSLPPHHRTAVPPLLERRTQAQGPVALECRPLLGDRVVQPQDHDVEHVHPGRGAEGLGSGSGRSGDRRPCRGCHLTVLAVVPRHAHVVEQRAFDGREADRQEAQPAIQQREAEFGVADRDPGTQQPLELARRPRWPSGIRTCNRSPRCYRGPARYCRGTAGNGRCPVRTGHSPAPGWPA